MYIAFLPLFCGFIVKCFRDVPVYVLERYINKYYYFIINPPFTPDQKHNNQSAMSELSMRWADPIRPKGESRQREACRPAGLSQWFGSGDKTSNELFEDGFPSVGKV